MAPNSSRKRLPFEPTGKVKGSAQSVQSSQAPGSSGSKQKLSSNSTSKPSQSRPNSKTTAPAKATSQANSRLDQSSTAIPAVVSQRMLRRMLFFSGTPTVLGVAAFFVSYWLIVKGKIELPPYAVLLTTLGCFGLGVLGLTYGVLSASWDEDRVGGWLGLEEFKVNFGRMNSAWGSKSAR